MKTLLKALCVLLLAFIFACLLAIAMEVQREDCDCIVFVDCCCPEAVGVAVTPTPSVATCPTDATPSHSQTHICTASATLPPNGDASKTPTPVIPTSTLSATIVPSATVVSIPTYTPALECYQWVCHKPSTAAERDYCCDSDGCVDAHLGHGDYLGRCR